MPMMKISSRPVVYTEMKECAPTQEQELVSSKLNTFLPKNNFELPSKNSMQAMQAMQAKNIAVLSQKALLAYKNFKRNGDFSSEISVTTALDLLAHASINGNEKLRLKACEVIIGGIEENKEAVCDLCALLLLGISKHPEMMTFLSKDTLAKLQSGIPQNSSAVSHMTFTEEEWKQICTLIQKRFASQGNVEFGPVRCYDLTAYLGNWGPIGPIFRELAYTTPLKLQVLEEKDIHVLGLYAEKCKNGMFSPENVPGFNGEFHMSFNELTVSKKLFDSSTGLQDLVKKLRDQNDNLKVMYTNDASEGISTAAVYPFSVFIQK